MSEYFISSGEVVYNITLDPGVMEVESGGVANNTIIVSGEQTVNGGGIANGTVVLSGSEAEIGGTAHNLTVSSFGFAEIYGVVSGISLDAGGVFVFSRGFVDNAIINQGFLDFSFGAEGDNINIYGGAISTNRISDVSNVDIYSGASHFSLALRLT